MDIDKLEQVLNTHEDRLYANEQIASTMLAVLTDISERLAELGIDTTTIDRFINHAIDLGDV